jgi:tRNA A37 N6-isopentenylltransferase MiaA
MICGGLMKELESFHAQTAAAARGGPAINFTQGILQAIGFKEFAPVLTAKAEGKEVTDALLAECVDDMKLQTRRFVFFTPVPSHVHLHIRLHFVRS